MPIAQNLNAIANEVVNKAADNAAKELFNGIVIEAGEKAKKGLFKLQRNVLYRKTCQAAAILLENEGFKVSFEEFNSESMLVVSWE